MPCCPHTLFQHLGGAGRCTVAGCDCLAYRPDPDPEQVSQTAEAARQARIERARAKRAEADAELRALGAEADLLRDTIAAYLRDGGEADEIAEAIGVSERKVQRVAKAIGLARPRGNPGGERKREAIRLHGEGVPVDQIASQMGLEVWRVVRFLGTGPVAGAKIDR